MATVPPSPGATTAAVAGDATTPETVPASQAEEDPGPASIMQGQLTGVTADRSSVRSLRAPTSGI